MKIYGHPMSTCTRKVLMSLAENNAEANFELVDIMKGEHKQPPHMAHQPFGQIPAMDDDGFALYESRAISRYVDQKFGGALTPKDARAHGLMEQWISVETSNVTPHMMTFVYEHVFQRPQGQAALDNARAKLEAAFAIMDNHLASHDYFAGDQFTIADVSFMPYFGYVALTPAKALIDAHPHLAAWWNRVSARPSWKKISA